MTVLTMPAQPGQNTALRPVPWRRMAWVTWRQHRPTLISVPAVLGAVAVFLLIAGLKIHHDYAVLTACHPASSPACQNLNSEFNSTDWTMANTVLILLNLAPALIGAFAGAPVLARELETGTYRYAWTQGFGRERWTIAKLALLAVTVTAAAGAFSQLFAWFFQPFLKQEDMTVLAATVFDTRGIAFAAWTLDAFAIGVLAGMLIRRIVPAMAVTLGVYMGLTLATWLFLREHYLPALVTSNPSITTGPLNASSPWILSTWYTGPGGKPASQPTVNQILQHYHQSNGPNGPVQVLLQHGYTQWWSYVPVNRFWPLQFVEGGWLLALSVLLIAATVWLVRHRAA
jgi:ABC-type transport system involved in multi-copper enzyme maturation permease subunit